VAGLLTLRRGWRPRPRRLIIGSVVAVVSLMVMPPLGSTDMLHYAAYGRIAVLGHSPYVMTPGQLESTGDAVGAVTARYYRNGLSGYGPFPPCHRIGGGGGPGRGLGRPNPLLAKGLERPGLPGAGARAGPGAALGRTRTDPDGRGRTCCGR
jgi:hypothetical protein